MKKEQENNDAQNIVPLNSNEIKSILKSQSESVFEDKNISNNSNFIKKSLIDIALDFETKQNIKGNEVIDGTPQNHENSKEENDVFIEEQTNVVKTFNENIENESKTDIQPETEQSNDEKDIKSTNNVNVDNIEEDVQSETMLKDESSINIETGNQKKLNDTTPDKEYNETTEPDNETQQALDSVRDAVSQSMNKSEDETTKTLEENNELTHDISETIKKDLEGFRNILKSLSTLTEEAIYEVFQNKIFEISYELAGYQIDKMPEKYEKKIKSFLKNINCYQDKITIEVNDEDFEALSKITNFNKNEEKKVFISNKELSRGDIILNCDGMRYSEKRNYSA